MLDSLMLSAALAEARDVLAQLRGAESRFLLRGAVNYQLGLRELHAAIDKLDKGIRQAERIRR